MGQEKQRQERYVIRTSVNAKMERRTASEAVATAFDFSKHLHEEASERRIGREHSAVIDGGQETRGEEETVIACVLHSNIGSGVIEVLHIYRSCHSMVSPGRRFVDA